MEWIKQTGGIPTAEAYGDFAGTNTQLDGNTLSGHNPSTKYQCKQNIPKAAKVESVHFISDQSLMNETAMEQHICNAGPISICVDASSWSTYTSGVMTASTCNGRCDHDVQAVGIDKATNTWIVRNEWGVDWGVTSSPSVAANYKYDCGSLSCVKYSAYLAAGYSARELRQYILKASWGTEAAVQCYAQYCSTATFGQPWITGNGGYIALRYGENTCNLARSAVVPTVGKA